MAGSRARSLHLCFFSSRRSPRARVVKPARSRVRKMEARLTEIIGAADARGATPSWWRASSPARRRFYQLPTALLLAAAPCLSAPLLEAPLNQGLSVFQSPGRQNNNTALQLPPLPRTPNWSWSSSFPRVACEIEIKR